MNSQQNIISVIVPILYLSPVLPIVRNHIQRATTPIEILLVVDTSVHETIQLLPNEKRVNISKRGRGIALAEGIRQSTGDIIIFVHADTLLPYGWDIAIRNALTDKQVIGGGFSHTFDSENGYLQFLARRPQPRLNLFREIWGEQAMFVRSQFIKQNISKIELPIMEDVQLSKLMNKNGKVVILKETVITSAATFLARGLLRNTFRVAKARLWYGVGGDPKKIYEYYYKK
jgi:glycosyltransferase involved in cell wall biosynthesis